ncbi:MAG: UTP--glucose-1-phosphate uridylyltransferase GalU [Bacillota bacterium]
MQQIRKAVIPAAGLGTRFLPATKAQPKEMLPLVDKPTIQFIIEEAVASGIKDILIITGRGKKAIEDHFDRCVELEEELEAKNKTELLKMVRDISDLAQIHYIRQKQALGLGHAISCARSFIGDEPFAVLLGDNVVKSAAPSLKQLIDVYERTGCTVIGVQDVPDEQVSRFGIVGAVGDPSADVFEVSRLVEKPRLEDAPSHTAILGRYVITPDIFKILERQTPGVNGEIQLTDAFVTLLKSKSIYARRIDGIHYDVGDKLGFLIATVEYALARPDISEQFLAYLKDTVQKNEERI